LDVIALLIIREFTPAIVGLGQGAAPAWEVRLAGRYHLAVRARFRGPSDAADLARLLVPLAEVWVWDMAPL